MATAAQIWPAPVTKACHLQCLREQGYLPEQKLGEWKAAGEHRISNLEPSKIVLFVLFVEHGLGLPASPFVHGLLHYYGISLNHLTPNSILHLSIFVHLCETFLGIPPSMTLFRYFLKLNPQPESANPAILGGAGIQFLMGRKSAYPHYTLIESVKN